MKQKLEIGGENRFIKYVRGAPTIQTFFFRLASKIWQIEKSQN